MNYYFFPIGCMGQITLKRNLCTFQVFLAQGCKKIPPRVFITCTICMPFLCWFTILKCRILIVFMMFISNFVLFEHRILNYVAKFVRVLTFWHYSIPAKRKILLFLSKFVEFYKEKFQRNFTVKAFSDPISHMLAFVM